MALLAAMLGSWLAISAQEVASSEVVNLEEGQPEEFRAARVAVEGFDEAAVLAALRLRLPRIAVEMHGGPAPEVSPHVYVQLSRGAADTGRLQVITSDGRGYERSFAIEVGQEVRVAASTAANLLFSIEQGAVAPDREDVVIPGAVEEAVPEPAPVVETPPIIKEEETVVTREVPAPVVVVERAWELAGALHGGAVLGVGAPNYGGVFAGAGGGLGLELRSPRGAAVAIDVRGIGQTASTFALGRVRVGVAGGYAWRGKFLEVPVLLGVTVEPWWASADIYSGATVTRRAPLIGGSLRVTPALRVKLARGPLAALRIGPRVEVAGSFAIDGGARVLGLADATGQAQARLGGLELGLGLEVALQWSLARRR